MQVLDKGAIELKNFMGGDLAVIAAARVSNGLSFEEASKGEQADQRLIKYLMKHRHGTPFEHSVFTFYVKAPIFVAREWFRHRMGSFNEISGRYVEFEPEFYIPTEFRVPATTNKQGSMPYEGPDPLWSWNIGYIYTQIVNRAHTEYQWLLKHGVAREMARMVLPLALYTQFYWTVNARALMNFISLREPEDAQWEIRQYATAIHDIFEEKMPLTAKAFNDGMVAP